MSQDSTMHTETGTPIRTAVRHYPVTPGESCPEFWKLQIQSDGCGLTVYFDSEQELADTVQGLRDGLAEIQKTEEVTA